MSTAAAARTTTQSQKKNENAAPVTLVAHGFSRVIPKIVLVGTSTGGPQALAEFLEHLSPHIDAVLVVVVLHMPPDFTSVVAGHIERVTRRPTKPAGHGEAPLPGHIYLAPGNTHLRVLRLGSSIVLAHHDSPPENFCKPAVDVLFRTAAQAYGHSALGVVLTGMGSDGLAGSRAIVEQGGSVIAQDEASSVVWGMPGAVARERLAAAVLPLDAIAPAVASLLKGIMPGGMRA